MISRRRFLCMSAACLAGPRAALADVLWTGQALGARAQLRLRIAPERADAVFAAVAQELQRIEALFSLYQPDSALSWLNRNGVFWRPDAEFLALFDHADALYQLSHGRFDPTVQSLWKALSEGRDAEQAMRLIGWDAVSWNAQRIALKPGQSLTFNGIAQGFATDRISALLRGFGLGHVLVNIGEFRAIGGPFHLGVEDPSEGEVARLDLSDLAVATSSAQASRVAGKSHILDPTGQGAPEWSTVSVLAESATLADGASTAICLMDKAAIKAALRVTPAIRRVHLVSLDGRYQVLLGVAG